ncbi:gephyrin-like molybdotransferase Glp [Dichotomicrobium thermohalophilum]|uniref:Molybdopterin molybdenumtransferase n=1 Tax=Dichotomicrobium thermohalophilum TaxID=933063 RepID=A0A397PE05_9HYPH|nr:gephyrin-like molybdotransferase Glp [Dichotomicrobium thermohalophilum]RIA47198.1 molybdopterin molybdochelatase [Dichotomicrobium thermohalophilum]
MTKMSRDDCFEANPTRMPFEESLERARMLADALGVVAPTETLPLVEACGRVLAAPISAPRDIPAHDNAAVDGYAFAFSDYDPENGTDLPVSARIAAGHPLDGALDRGTAARIFTGAVMPDGADTVAMQEDTYDDGDGVNIPPGLKQGANRRKAGEDVRAGQTLLRPGCLLRPQDIAAIASLGFAEARCYRRVRVGLFSSGDELLRPGDPFRPGAVYDSNAAMLEALADLAGAEITDLGVLPDSREAVQGRLKEAAADYPLILSSGGASLGEEDHLTATLHAAGEVSLWQVAIKPGRPICAGRIGGSAIVGLPGNPVAAFVCFLLYVYPLIQSLGGAGWRRARRYTMPAAFAMTKKPGRREFIRGMLDETEGELRARNYERTGSGLITSLREADGLIELPEKTTEIAPGDPIAFIPFTEFGVRP